MEILKTLLALALLGLGAFVGFLLIAGGMDGHEVEQGSVRLRGSKALVMERLSYPELRERWVVDCTGATSFSTRYPVVGSRWEETVRRDGTEEERSYEVVKIEPGRRLVLRTSWDDIELVLSYDLNAFRTGSQTLVTYSLEARFEGWKEKLLEALLADALFAEMKRDMENLARVDLDA